MKKSIVIEGKPFYYEAENLSVDTDPIITFEQAKTVLFKAKELLDQCGIEFGLIYGTLLGAIREHSFIKHDYDVDIYVKDKNALLRAIPDFYQKGFKLCRVVGDRLYSFRYNGGAYVDMYILRKAPFPFNLYCYFVGRSIMPKHYYDNTKKIEFLGEKFTVPAEAERALEMFYGKTWRIPIKKGYGGRNGDVYPVYWYRKIKKWLNGKKKNRA